MNKNILFKYITITILVSSFSFINAKEKLNKIDETVINYQKEIIISNPNYDLNSIKLDKKVPIGKDWNAYHLTLDLKNKKSNTSFKTPYFVFSNGRYITHSITDMKTDKKYGYKIMETQKRKEEIERKKDSMKFKKRFILDKKYYTDKKLIVGSHNATTKIAIFSDPLCVYCIKYVPRWIEKIKKKKDVALYYFHFPLDMHPTAKIVIKAIQVAKEKGIIDAEYKVYKANMENYFNVYRTKDPKVALDAINKILGTEILLNDLNSIEFDKDIENDIAIGYKAKISGTPSVFFNGSAFEAREKLSELLN